MIQVLVVDDNPADARWCKEVLKTAAPGAFAVKVTSDLDEAQDQLDSSSFDAVVLDLGLPGTTGLDTLEKFRGFDTETPVVVLTGLADDAIGRQAVSLGAQDYLVKGSPELEHVLARTLRFAVERTQLSHTIAKHQRHELIARLAGGVAHDFNNILASVMGFADLATQNLGTNDIDKIAGYLDRIRNSSIRGRDLVRQLLEFGRADMDRGQKSVDVDEACSEIVNNIKPLIPSSIALRWVPGAEGAWIRSDRVHLHQIVMNLVVNARDALGGKGRIDIGTLVSEYEGHCVACGHAFAGSYVAVTVSDSGPGVDAGLVKRIFDAYFTTKPPDKGSGMGLSVVSGIVHGYGGHVLIGTGELGGASVTILLPMTEPTGSETAGSAAQIESSRGIVAGRRILVVDDEEDLRDVLVEFLETSGYEVASAADGLSARACFQSGAPAPVDLVITDQTMPGATGLELAAWVKRFDPGIPVVLCTGYSTDISPTDAKPSHVDHVVFKPFDVEMLNVIVEDLLTDRFRDSTHSR